jgi:hypothetical protein
MHCPAWLVERSGPRGRPYGNSSARNGTLEAARLAPAPASPAETAAAPAGGRGWLLAVVPVNGGSARLAIVGYLLPLAREDGQAGEEGSRTSANGPPAGRASADGVLADGLVVDAAGYRVLAGGRNAGLVLREFELLAFLAANPGQVFTRAHLLARVWGNTNQAGTRTVDVHIHRLRRKLGPEYGHRLITVRHVGYMYQPDR